MNQSRVSRKGKMKSSRKRRKTLEERHRLGISATARAAARKAAKKAAAAAK